MNLGLLSDSLAALRIDANAAVQGRRYASVKSQGAYRLKPKKTIPKKLGAKKTGGMFAVRDATGLVGRRVKGHIFC